jgi:hypothetical protein
MEPVLEHALVRLGRSVGYDAARALAYDPAVMIPVSFAASDRRGPQGTTERKYRKSLIGVVSIGVRAGQLGRTDAWLSSHLVSHA